MAAGVLLGGAVGMWLSRMWLDGWLPGVVVGAVLGGCLAVALDAWRGNRAAPMGPGAVPGSDLPRMTRSTEASGGPPAGPEAPVRPAAQHERDRLDQFLSAIEASPNGVLLLDDQDRIDWCNSVAADHFGLDPQRDKLQRVTNLVRVPAFVSYLQQGNFDEPVTFNSPGGQLLLSVLIRRYSEGLKLVMTQDITERERAEGMRRDFVANVSHEIRTPLTVLSGFVETMASLPLTEVERQRVLTLMGQQTERMQTLVSDLLMLARLEGSPRPPSDRWVSLDKMLVQLQSDARALSAERHQITFTGTPGLEVAGAESELCSAIANLVSNAIRYTPTGGQIDVHWALRADRTCEIDVLDSGIGIAREHIPRITERFYRADGSRSRDTGGTGLGLSIVKHVVQRHAGELDVKSEPGKGSRFRIVLPAVRVRAVDKERDAALPG
jgi:two-component system phosphate regulon sensor histidine kinase PhoR